MSNFTILFCDFFDKESTELTTNLQVDQFLKHQILEQIKLNKHKFIRDMLLGNEKFCHETLQRIKQSSFKSKLPIVLKFLIRVYEICGVSAEPNIGCLFKS